MPPTDEWILVGRLVGVFGLAGELKIESLTDFPQRFEPEKSLYLGEARRQYTIQSSRPHKSHMLVKFHEVSLVESAQKLLDMEAYVRATEAIPLAPNEYLFSDLVGIEVRTAEGTKLGTISEVLRTGSNDVYVVANGRQSILIPGVRDAVVELDIPGRRMVVESWAAAPGI